MKSYTQCAFAREKFRNVFIVESRDWWETCRTSFDPDLDVVFSYDFGLRRDIENAGGRAGYVDHAVDPEVMERNSRLVYAFLREWHRRANGTDLFEYRGVPFGFTFRIDIWNDLVYRVRTHLCVEAIAALAHETMFVGTSLGLVEDSLTRLGVNFTSVKRGERRAATYFFPIHRWMDEKVRSRRLKHKIKPFVAVVMGLVHAVIRPFAARRIGVFVHEYYPTREILRRLQADRRLRVVLARYTAGTSVRKLLREHPIPVAERHGRFRAEAQRLMRRFKGARSAKLVLTTGADVSAEIYSVFEWRVSSEIEDALSTLDSVIRYLDRYPIALEVMVGNVGRMQTLVDCVCKVRGIHSYMIINGLLSHSYLDEAKYADTINSYSEQIKRNYFRDMSNVICLGDPRMDDYAASVPRRVDRVRPTITIGASGHNITNLASYVAVEFEFLHDVLAAIELLRARRVDARVVIKVRDNGYLDDYRAFVNEYFPGSANEIVQSVPMKQVLERTDVYISIYSQTLFEASALGIPAIYYKKDTETLDAPFDRRSELVTVDTIEDLATALVDFTKSHDRFAPFLRRDVMEKYIGFLDGRNVDRNMDCIYGLLRKSVAEFPSRGETP